MHSLALPPEELARANFYSLLSRLFSAAPDVALLERLAGAQDLDAADSLVADAWQALMGAAARADAGAVRKAYQSAFADTSKSRVSLHARAYASSKGLLPRLQADLGAFGLAPRGGSQEALDHIAGLCDVMRHLIQAREHGLAQQGRFFERWIAPAAQPLCEAVAKHLRGSFYEHVARFAAAFFEIERCAFDMAAAETPRRFGSWSEPDTRFFRQTRN